jgi:hypothetical protein
VDGDVLELEVPAAAVDHAALRRIGHAAAAHDVRRDHACEERFERQLGDRRAGFRPGAIGSCALMHRHDRRRTGRELELRHREQRAPDTVPYERRQRIGEHRRAVGPEPHDPAAARRMEAVAQQREQHLSMGKGLHPVRMRRPDALIGHAEQHRMERRRLELEADRTVDRSVVQEVIGVDRLRRAGIGLDRLRHDGCRDDGGVEKGAPPEHAVRIRCAASQQQRRRADPAGGEHIVPRPDAHAPARR